MTLAATWGTGLKGFTTGSLALLTIGLTAELDGEVTAVIEIC
jgi:hypothetical protein